ncbi:MAG TPA: hypothetical protein VL346_09560 [Acidobacteriaceae bacterium]|nr:hypothetical protein [Acidobacteriaceae bacterium]
MPASKTGAATSARRKDHSSAEGRLDILFGGPLLFVPEIAGKNIVSVDVFFPINGHPVGAVFLPETWFSAEELDDPACERWPESSSFSLLDPHSYSIDLAQSGEGESLSYASIPSTNHKIRPGRRLSDAWEISIAVRGRLTGWSSHRHSRVTSDLYVGADTPASETIAAMHKLTFEAVTTAEFHGAGHNPRAYLRQEAHRGGSLIILGEVPYQSTLLHERRAIEALAQLAGLDLHLADTNPQPHLTRLMNHTGNCGHSIVIAPE